MKSFNTLLVRFISILAVFALTAKLVYALDVENQSPAKNNISDEDINLTDTSSQAPARVNLTIRIEVHRTKNVTESCRIYPYPVAPPPKKGDPAALPIKDKPLRQVLLNMGYFNKMRQEKPFPTGGWRMQYALEAAMKKSGFGPPHSIFTEYAWADNIIPYMRKETIAINKKELERMERYNLAQAVFNDHRADLEVQSFNQGLFPIDVPIHRELGGYRIGRVVVNKATWWIAAMHKVPGLKYYWLWPVKLNDSSEQLVVLNEDNAIYIDGAW